MTWPSKIVSAIPSTRRLTVTGTASAAGAAARESTTSATGSAVRLSRVSIEPPLPRGSYGLRPESGLLASDSTPRLPGEQSAPQWLHATHQRPFTVAGPRGIRTRLPWPPAVERSEHTPPRHTLPRPLKSLAAFLPPSSRGLGHRPLTAETGVRIPVAVLPESAPALYARAGRSLGRRDRGA